MNFQLLEPVLLLRGYIEKIWILQTDGPMPHEDLKLVVPNGRLLLVLPFRNGITGRMNGKNYLARQNSLALTGMCDAPSVVDTQFDAPTGTIGVEFSAAGAYRFFHLRMKALSNALHPLTDLLGATASLLEEKMAGTDLPLAKAEILQQFLLQRFLLQEPDAVFDHCVNRIMQTNGNLAIKALERETGYTGRWLNKKFEEKLGLGPKTLGSILRFQQFYQPLMNAQATAVGRKDLYQAYHDESHFIRDFKRFTGLPPVKYSQYQNAFGRLFY